MSMISIAFDFAYKSHSGQVRSDANNTPYIIHPIRVYDIMRRFTDENDILVAALLHDTVEDTSVTLKDIRDLFNDEVANIVDQLSNPPDIKGSKDKHKEKLNRFKSFILPSAMIKLADMISNLEDVRSRVCHKKWSNKKKIKYINRCGEYGEWIIKHNPGIEYSLQKLWFEEYGKALSYAHTLQFCRPK